MYSDELILKVLNEQRKKIVELREKIYDNYGMFPSFDIFEQVFQQLTENYGIMVFNNSSNVYWLDDIKK